MASAETFPAHGSPPASPEDYLAQSHHGFLIYDDSIVKTETGFAESHEDAHSSTSEDTLLSTIANTVFEEGEDALSSGTDDEGRFWTDCDTGSICDTHIGARVESSNGDNDDTVLVKPFTDALLLAPDDGKTILIGCAGIVTGYAKVDDTNAHDADLEVCICGDDEREDGTEDETDELHAIIEESLRMREDAACTMKTPHDLYSELNDGNSIDVPLVKLRGIWSRLQRDENCWWSKILTMYLFLSAEGPMGTGGTINKEDNDKFLKVLKAVKYNCAPYVVPRCICQKLKFMASDSGPMPCKFGDVIFNGELLLPTRKWEREDAEFASKRSKQTELDKIAWALECEREDAELALKRSRDRKNWELALKRRQEMEEAEVASERRRKTEEVQVALKRRRETEDVQVPSKRSRRQGDRNEVMGLVGVMSAYK